METKTCTKCKEIKTVENFYKASKSTRGRFTPECKPCTIARSQNYYTRVKTTKYKDSYLKRNFGIDLNIYLELRSSQEEKCAICKRHESVCRFKSLNVDHDHTTGKIRGLLCDWCNRAIGLLHDSPEVLISAAQYIKDSK